MKKYGKDDWGCIKHFDFQFQIFNFKPPSVGIEVGFRFFEVEIENSDSEANRNWFQMTFKSLNELK